jgi:hypothetical protein
MLCLFLWVLAVLISHCNVALTFASGFRFRGIHPKWIVSYEGEFSDDELTDDEVKQAIKLYNIVCGNSLKAHLRTDISNYNREKYNAGNNDMPLIEDNPPRQNI